MSSERGVDYWRRAGVEAIEQSANAEAVECLQSALRQLPATCGGTQRAREELELRLLLALAQAAVSGQGSAEVERTYLRARDLCEQVGDAHQRFSVYRGLWAFYHLRARYNLARTNGQQLLAQADEAGNTAYRLEAHRALGITWLLLGEFDAAARHFDEGSALYDADQHSAHAYVYGTDPGVVCLSFGAYAYWFRGFPEQALARSVRSVELAEDKGHPYSIAFALNVAGHVRSRRREARAAGEYAARLMELAHVHDYVHWLAMGRILMGWSRVQQGMHNEGIAQMRHGLGAYQDTGGKRSLSFFLTLLAEAYSTCGLFDQARSTVADGLVAVAESGERHFEAELHRLNGQLSWRLGGAGAVREAEASFSQSLLVARHQGARAWQLRTATSLARLWKSQGNGAQGRELLSSTYATFTEGRQTADALDASKLLAELALY